MKYWLHRISHEKQFSESLLENSYLPIGFSDFSSREYLQELTAENSEDKWDHFEKWFDTKWGCRPRKRYFLWYFTVDMRQGHIVLVPEGNTFSLYKILGDHPILLQSVIGELSDFSEWSDRGVEVREDGYIYHGNDSGEKSQLDIGFVRSVELIARGISKKDYADNALSKRMKYQGTTVEITDLKKSIDAALKGHLSNRPINLHALLLERAIPGVVELIREKMTDRKLEDLVRLYFEHLGATDAWIPPKKQPGKVGDADVVATFEPLKLVVYVQVKQHEGTTSDWAIDQIKHYKDYRKGFDQDCTASAWVISMADNYSKDALQEADENGVHLVNAEQFAAMLLEAGIDKMKEIGSK